MKYYVTLSAFLMLFATVTGQENPTTLEEQFTDVIEKSNRYQDYKVVKTYKLNNLRKSVNDSIAQLEQTIDAAEGKIQEQQSEIEGLTANLAATENDLTLSKQKEDGISLLGTLLKKSTYNTIMWSVIGLLLLGLVILFFKFKSSHRVTREAQVKLAETEEEFENHRQRTLEREQQLRRKLQDEINKQRKVQ